MDGRRGRANPPPPPPAPTVEMLLATQTELLQRLVENQQAPPQQPPQQQQAPREATFQDFLSTQPPLFTRAEEPLDADAWIRIIESRFVLLTHPCSAQRRAIFAAEQLRGEARLWWDDLVSMQPAAHIFTWEEFRTAFRAHHIPRGLLDRKLNEFLALTQGSRSVE